MIRLLFYNIFGHRASYATTKTKNDYREKVTMIVRFVSAEKWYIVLVWTAGCLCWDSSLRCPPAATLEQCTLRHGILNELFLRCNGKSVLRIKSDEVTSVKLTCTNNYTLESGPLPTFNTTKTFSVVEIARCPPPSVGYGAALLRLNISVGSNLTLKFAENHSRFVLRANLFESMNLSKLSISADKPMKTDEKFLGVLGNPTVLQLWNVALDNATLARVLPALVYLELYRTGVDGLDLSGARRLVEAAVTDPVAGLTLGPNLRKLRLAGARSLELRECAALRELHVSGSGALPPDWLNGCSVEILTIRSYAASAWRAPRGLRRLEIIDSDLRDMPAAPPLLLHAQRLEVLRLEHCRIDVIPDELFRNASGLKSLDLSRNRLGSQLCGAGGRSPLRWLSALETLVAVNVSAASVCPAWRRLPRLRHVDLQLNHIHDLRLVDLEWAGEGEVTVEVGGPVRGLRLGAEREERVAATARVRLRAVWALGCSDCQEAARMARALGPRTPAWLRAARCAPASPTAPRLLEPGVRACLLPDGDPTSSQCFRIATRSSCWGDAECPAWRRAAEPGGSEAACPLSDAACPEPCRCAAWLDRAEQRCAGAGLVALPPPARPPSHLPLAALHLADNRIADLRASHLAAFPDLSNLNLTNNLISTLDDETVAALFAGNRSVALAGNPLRCASACALLRVVAERPHRVDAAARCADLDVALRDAARAGLGKYPACAPPLAPLFVLPMLLLPAAALAAALATRALRARLKLLLLDRGPRPQPAADVDRSYDAYVSAAAEDAAFAAELAARLEGAGRRLCLPDRDWVPGAWVPAEISRSVRGARRTVALVSARGVRAAGARAALREALAAGRLVVVLLPGCAPAVAAAPELRAHLAAVTYLRWEEPRFWSRLLLAVAPRSAAPSPSQGKYISGAFCCRRRSPPVEDSLAKSESV